MVPQETGSVCESRHFHTLGHWRLRISRRLPRFTDSPRLTRLAAPHVVVEKVRHYGRRKRRETTPMLQLLAPAIVRLTVTRFSKNLAVGICPRGGGRTWVLFPISLANAVSALENVSCVPLVRLSNTECSLRFSSLQMKFLLIILLFALTAVGLVQGREQLFAATGFRGSTGELYILNPGRWVCDHTSRAAQ